MCQNPTYSSALKSAAAVVVVSEIAAVEVAAEDVVFVVVLGVNSVVVSDMELETETSLSSGFSFVKYKNANTTKAIMTNTRSMLSTITGAFDFPGVFSALF